MKTTFSQGNRREVAKILQSMPYFHEKTMLWLASVFYPRGTFFSFFFCGILCTLFIFLTKRVKLASNWLVVIWQPRCFDAAFMFILIKLPKRNMNSQCTKEIQIKNTGINNCLSLLVINKVGIKTIMGYYFYTPIN